jgi:amino acid transporter
MKRFLRHAWESITRSKVTGRVLVVLIVLLVLAIAMVLSGPKPPSDFDPFAHTPTPATLEVTDTVTPPIPSTEYKLTNGVVLAVVSVVLIVFIGTIFHFLRYKKVDRE